VKETPASCPLEAARDDLTAHLLNQPGRPLEQEGLIELTQLGPQRPPVRVLSPP
jgi:hypothetical protein